MSAGAAGVPEDRRTQIEREQAEHLAALDAAAAADADRIDDVLARTQFQRPAAPTHTAAPEPPHDAGTAASAPAAADPGVPTPADLMRGAGERYRAAAASLEAAIAFAAGAGVSEREIAAGVGVSRGRVRRVLGRSTS